MKKLEQLQRLKDLEKKVETHVNSAFVVVEPEELMAISELNRPADPPPEAAGPAPGHFDRMAEERHPAELVEYTSTPEPDAPLTPEEEKYAHHGDLLAILADNPSEIPLRVRQRAERLLKLREETNRKNPWSWMT